MAALTGDLGWGLLVVGDSGAGFRDLPERWPGEGRERPPVVAGEDAFVVSVRHPADGGIEVRFWAGEEDWGRRGACELAVVAMRVPSGVVVLGDVLRETVVRADVGAGRYRVQINADNAVYPAVIDVVAVREPERP
ncbi:hypothetical protein [Dactylosporangium salmoneum]|uniref:hypothetical protein n=1 Tax=Dactylosporangium salmoneum TaxID=53361 RepID=UPI0031D41B00